MRAINIFLNVITVAFLCPICFLSNPIHNFLSDSGIYVNYLGCWITIIFFIKLWCIACHTNEGTSENFNRYLDSTKALQRFGVGK